MSHKLLYIANIAIQSTYIARHYYFNADSISFMKRSMLSPIVGLIVFSKPGREKKKMQLQKKQNCRTMHSCSCIVHCVHALPEVISFSDFALLKSSIQAGEEVLGFAVLHIIVKITLPIDVNSNLSSLAHTQKTGKQAVISLCDKVFLQ